MLLFKKKKIKESNKLIKKISKVSVLLFLQLWVNLAKEHKMTEPQYQELKDKNIPRTKKDGVEVKVIAGESMGIKVKLMLYLEVHYFYFFSVCDGRSSISSWSPPLEKYSPSCTPKEFCYPRPLNYPKNSAPLKKKKKTDVPLPVKMIAPLPVGVG